MSGNLDTQKISQFTSQLNQYSLGKMCVCICVFQVSIYIAENVKYFFYQQEKPL